MTKGVVLFRSCVWEEYVEKVETGFEGLGDSGSLAVAVMSG